MACLRSPWLFLGVLVACAPMGCDGGGGDGTTGGGASGGGGETSGSTETTGKGGDGAGGGSGGAGAGTTAGGGSGGVGGGQSFAGFTRVDEKQGTAVPGSADVAIAPDGTIYVVWVDEQGGARDVWLARSQDGGASFEAALQIDDAAIVPLVSMARHPYVAADDDRVAVTFNDEGGTVRLYVSAAGGALDFDPPVVLGEDVNTDFRDFPKPAFLTDGGILVAWQGYPLTGARIFVSRESAGFASEVASGGAPGVPCECCPLDIVSADSGDVMVAFRNNDSNTREMWFAGGPLAGPFAKWAAISTSEGTVNACPMQGPRLAQTGPTDHLAVWSVRGAESAGTVFVSTSSDAGSAWSGGEAAGGFVGDEPTIAVGGDGRVYVTAVTGVSKSKMAFSDDGGKTWSAAEPITSPDGDIRVPQAEGNGGVAALAGVSTAGSVWLLRMQ